MQANTIDFRRARGVVLPVVLVILTVLTGLIVTQVKRGTTDERLAANARETVVLDNMAQTALRWCEQAVTRTPFNLPNVSGTAATPAWLIAANWNDLSSLDMPPALMPGATEAPVCVIEAAQCELRGAISEEGIKHDGCNGINGRWQKYRITARVRLNAPDLPNGRREMMAQSELRLWTD